MADAAAIRPARPWPSRRWRGQTAGSLAHSLAHGMAGRVISTAGCRRRAAAAPDGGETDFGPGRKRSSMGNGLLGLARGVGLPARRADAPIRQDTLGTRR